MFKSFSQAPNQRVQRVQVHPLFFWSRSLVVLNKSRILLSKSRILLNKSRILILHHLFSGPFGANDYDIPIQVQQYQAIYGKSWNQILLLAFCSPSTKALEIQSLQFFGNICFASLLLNTYERPGKIFFFKYV